MHFEVADTGPGMSERDLSRLFERYWTDHRGRGRGIGLGLFISKGIVEAHGGHISVESTMGRGTTFHFTIPTLSVTQSPGCTEAFQGP
jgi:signal transduction histidine kinase